jgi:hypothetical protein
VQRQAFGVFLPSPRFERYKPHYTGTRRRVVSIARRK